MAAAASDSDIATPQSRKASGRASCTSWDRRRAAQQGERGVRRRTLLPASAPPTAEPAPVGSGRALPIQRPSPVKEPRWRRDTANQSQGHGAALTVQATNRFRIARTDVKAVLPRASRARRCASCSPGRLATETPRVGRRRWFRPVVSAHSAMSSLFPAAPRPARPSRARFRNRRNKVSS